MVDPGKGRWSGKEPTLSNSSGTPLPLLIASSSPELQMGKREGRRRRRRRRRGGKRRCKKGPCWILLTGGERGSEPERRRRRRRRRGPPCLPPPTTSSSGGERRHGPDGSGLKVSKICRISNLRRKVKICQEKEK